ncbi:MAG: HlyC/CorC family transporter [Thermomicrobiales bacterium]|nr:HlyC/CorC family transporter [Thermomicrobiales bacterium]
MDGYSWTLIAIAALSMIAMAAAATVEASAGLISRHRLRQGATGPARERSVQRLLDPRRSLISALQLVQAIAIALAASCIAVVILRHGGPAAIAIAVIVVALLFLLLGQAIPRALTRTRPAGAANLLLGAARVMATLVRPLSAISDGAANLLTRLLGGERPDTLPAGTEDEFLQRGGEGIDDDVIEPEERLMIDNVLHLEEKTARDIMVPRVDIVAVDEEASAPEIVDTVIAHGHSRLPVYRESIDQIVGILYAKDLLPFVIGSTRMLPLRKLVRPAYVVPESKRIDDLLTELRRNRVHIAIVADEYGGTAGLVTIEDILEEIVGEIHDEYDEETILLEYVSDREIIADGRLPIEDVERALGLQLTGEDDSYGTAAGFVHWHLDRLPRPGDRFDAQGIRAEVLDMEGHRLRHLRLTRLDEGEAALDPAVNDQPPQAAS